MLPNIKRWQIAPVISTDAQLELDTFHPYSSKY